jgi:hypothetical protein
MKYIRKKAAWPPAAKAKVASWEVTIMETM